MAAGLVEPSTSTAVSAVISTPVAGKWFDSFDDTLKNYITTRGLTEKDPATAFAETAKAHQEAQAFIGTPTENLLRLPKADAPPEEWDAVYERLGYSKDAAAYKFEGVEAPDAVKAFALAQAQAFHLSPAAATKLAAETAAYLNKSQTEQTSEQAVANARAAEQLRQSWGPNYQANMTIADRAFLAIQAAAGVDGPTMQANMTKLKEVVGTEGVMQMLLAVGQRISEDTFTAGANLPADPAALIASREQAVARKEQLMGDEEWRKRFMGGGVAEVREMAQLDMRIAGVNDRGEPL